MNLHILNGDATREIFEKSGIPGDIHVVREMLLESPFELNCDWDDLFEMRAEWLQSRFGIPAQDYLAEKTSESELIERLSRYQSVYCWFDSDLFCQLNLIYALSWFAIEPMPHTTVYLITPTATDKHPRTPLSLLPPSAFPELMAQAHPVSITDIDMADAVLIAFGAESPLPLLKLTQSLCPHRLASLPDMKQAIETLFTLYPSPLDGLGLSERLILAEIPNRDGISLGDLLKRMLSNRESEHCGMTDLLLYFHLNQFLRGERPLITLQGIARLPDFGTPLSDRDATESRIALTSAGQEVLAGSLDRIACQPIDRWIGGVHLSQETGIWRFDGTTFTAPVE